MHPDHGVGAFSLQKLNLGKKGESSQSSKTDRIQGEDFNSQHRSQVTATGVHIQARDRVSVESDDSKGMIIRKDVHYDVQYYDREQNGPGNPA